MITQHSPEHSQQAEMPVAELRAAVLNEAGANVYESYTNICFKALPEAEAAQAQGANIYQGDQVSSLARGHIATAGQMTGWQRL